LVFPCRDSGGADAQSGRGINVLRDGLKPGDESVYGLSGLNEKGTVMKFIPSIFLVLLVASCSTAPITGRKQVKIIPEEQLIAESAASYAEVIKERPLSQNAAQAEMIRRVGRNISAAVERYFRERGEQELLAGFNWEFNLIDEDVPNAWCMPGGKVVFYSGILPYTKDETGIAVVMGHEIAHAVAGHGAERVSHQVLQQGGGYILSLFSQESDYHGAIMEVYGLTTQLGGILPYSRVHESEADRMGLIFMAMAGYDPNASIEFWRRMASGKSGAPPELLSTHPSDRTRIENLKAYMPEALHYYRR
jgi:predicted Zn-dependent protease